jgi:hypothetical protein
MQDQPPSPPGDTPAREKPPSGLRITLVLLGIILAVCLVCALFTGGYAYYLDLRSGWR